MTRPRRFELIVFDWDGTLFDSTALIVQCIQGACRDLDVTVPDESRAAYVIGLGLHDALRHAVPDLPAERYAELGLRFRHHYLARQHELVLFPGTLAMLEALKARRHLLAVATGKGRRGLDDALAHSALGALFDATRTADETAPKPDPQMLLELMAQLDIAAARTLMVGDTTHDLQLAAGAGAHSVAVSHGAHDQQALAALAPLAIVHSTRELHDWLVVNA